MDSTLLPALVQLSPSTAGMGLLPQGHHHPSNQYQALRDPWSTLLPFGFAARTAACLPAR